MNHIHQLSDIDLALKPYLAECITTEGATVTTSEGAIVVVNHPMFHDYDFKLTLSSGKLKGYGATVTVGRKDGEYYGCTPLENGLLRVIADNHHLPPGRLWAQLLVYFPDELHPDGVRTVASEWDTGQEIVTEGPRKAAVTEQVRLSIPAPKTDDSDVKVSSGCRHEGFVTGGVISCGAKEGKVYRNKHNTMRLPMNGHLKKSFDISFIPDWEECKLVYRRNIPSDGPPVDRYGDWRTISQEGSVITIEYHMPEDWLEDYFGVHYKPNWGETITAWHLGWEIPYNYCDIRVGILLPERFQNAKYLAVINGKLAEVSANLGECRVSPPTFDELKKVLYNKNTYSEKPYDKTPNRTTHTYVIEKRRTFEYKEEDRYKRITKWVKPRQVGKYNIVRVRKKNKYGEVSPWVYVQMFKRFDRPFLFLE